VIGVCAEGAPAYKLSFDAGRVIETESSNTIADGIAVRQPVATALETMRRAVDRVALVPDAEILAAVRLLYDTTGLVAEGPTGAALALLLRDPGIAPMRPVVIPNCGGNLTDEQKRSWLGISCGSHVGWIGAGTELPGGDQSRSTHNSTASSPVHVGLRAARRRETNPMSGPR
jgi:threonine dehydratase